MKRWNRFAALWLPLLLVGAAAVAAHADNPPTTNQPIVIEAPAVGRAPAAPPAADDAASAFDRQPLGAPPRQRDEPLPQANPTATPGNWWLQTFMALGIVIALIFGLRWVMRRMSGATGVGGGAGLVEVLARTPIGHKTQILFLRVNERVIVAGQTPAGLSTLAEFDDPDDVAAVLQQVESSRPTSISRGFATLLGQVEADEDTSRQAGLDDSEHLIDRTRDGLSGLARRIRSLRGGGDR